MAVDSVHWYMEEVGARVVAKTGIPSDRYHLGKLILHSLQDDPEFILQIDGATGESETFGSALNRSIRCAVSLTNMGIQKDDVMVLMGPNHLDFCVPHNAGLYLGIMVASIDVTLGVNELTKLFETNQPKIIFCQSEKTGDIEEALRTSKVDAIVVTFDEDSHHTTLAQLLKVEDQNTLKNFKNQFSKFPTPTRMALMTSPAQWLSAGIHYLFSAIFKYTRLQTSATVTPEHFAELVNKYKPTFQIISPNLMLTMITKANCDFTCFEFIILGGSAVAQDVVDEVKLVDPNTNEVITEPNVPGEAWFKGPSIFKGYYNNPEVTKATITEDGWLKSGDIFYRDENWNLFFVGRHKLLLKYRNHQVSPVEVEEVIMKHPGVFHVAVTGIPDRECGDLVVACVVPKPGCSPSAQEIKDLVKESLTDSKQLRGGVIFLNELPLTSTSKVNRQILKELVLTLPRE